MKNFLYFNLFFIASYVKASVFVNLDMDDAQIGDYVEFTVTVKGSLDGSLELPELDNLNIVGESSSSSYSYSNGAMSRTHTYSYTLVPTKEGVQKIPSFAVSIGGKTFNTRELSFNVTTPSSKVYGKKRKRSPQDDDEEPNKKRQRVQDDDDEFKEEEAAREAELPIAFVIRELSENEVFVGKPIISIIKFYYAVNAQNLSVDPSNLDAFRYFDFKQEIKKERYKGKLYNTLILRQLLMPVKSGEYELEPFLLTAELLFKKKGGGSRRQRSLFDDFFSGSRYNVSRKSFATEKEKIIVKPVPTKSRPKSYKGLVGSFGITAELSDNEVSAGETTTLTITIFGAGDLNSAAKPKLNLPKSIKIYADKPESREGLDEEKGLISEKTFKFALVPTKKGSYDLGTYVESYFNFDKGAFKTLEAKLGVLEVEGEDKSLEGVSGKDSNDESHKEQVKSLSSDLIDIKRNIKPSSLGSEKGFFGSLLFYVTSLLSLFYLFLALFPKLSFLSPKMTAKRRRQLAFKLYKDKRKKLLGGKAKIEESTVLFKSFLADKFDLNASSLTVKELSYALDKVKMSSEFKVEVLTLFQKLEKISFGYAPSNSLGPEESLKLIHDLVGKVESHV